MADVYILASPSPTLYAYPSALHPATVTTSAGSVYPKWEPVQEQPVRDDVIALLLAKVI